MTVNIIAAVAKNRAIGKDNKLIYWLPNDLKRFKALTTGHTIVMGRKTFESLPKGALPNRRNIVLTRSARQFPGCDCYSSLEEALLHCEPDEDVFIIGGASVYRQALSYADRLYMTEVEDTPSEADAFFPLTANEVECLNQAGWKKVKEETHNEGKLTFRFVDLEKC